ncbi:MAG: O-antigen polymerase [Chloroflexota bacterium]
MQLHAKKNIEQSRLLSAQQFVADLWLALLPFAFASLGLAFELESLEVTGFLIVLLFGCSFILCLRRIRRDLLDKRFNGLAVLIGFVFWYSYPALINLIIDNGKFGHSFSIPITNRLIILTTLYLSMFLLSWMISYHVFVAIQTKRVMIPTKDKVQRINVKRVIFLSIVCCLIGLLPYILSGLSFNQVIESVLQGREASKPWLHLDNLGNSTSPFLFLAQTSLVAGCSLLWGGLLYGNISRWARLVIFGLASCFSLLLFFDNGTRALTALVLLPVIGVWVTQLWKRYRIRAFVIISGLLVLLFLVFQFQLLFRVSRTRDTISASLFERWATLGGTTDYFEETLFTVSIVPEFHDFFYESATLQFLVFPIPRFIWPEKPASEVVWFYSLMRWNIDIYQGGGNVFPGIVGQYYMSWRELGPVIVAVTFGLLTAYFDRLFTSIWRFDEKYMSLMAAMLAVGVFISFRFVSPSNFYPIGLAYFILLMSQERSQKKRFRRRRVLAVKGNTL